MKKQEHLLNRSPFGTWKCKYCNFIGVTRRELQKHRKQFHPEHAVIGGGCWNKGLTKDVNDSLKRASESLKRKIETDEEVKKKVTHKGQKLSKTARKNISIGQLKRTAPSVCKRTEPWIKIDGTIVNLDSSYERTVAKILDTHFIEWIRPNPLEWVDSKNVTHHYFPDFYIPSVNLYLDPKNDYCFKVQSEKIFAIQKKYKNVLFLKKEDLTEENILKIVQYISKEECPNGTEKDC